MKSQSLIVQFVLFFVIGLGFFLLAGNLFRFQSNFIRQDILDFGSELLSKQTSSFIITAINSCKSCDKVSTSFNVKSITGNFPIIAFTANKKLTVSLEEENKLIESSVHNLLYSVNLETNAVSSARSINLTYDKIKNNLVIR